MMINHEPIFDTKRVCELYSKKDGVPVKYVCTSAPNEHASYAADIFYRETPHPEFGNHYFGLYHNPSFSSDGTIMITNADPIEDLTFTAIYSNMLEQWVYSKHRHDYREVPGENVAIDGGRSYDRMVGDFKSAMVKTFVVKDGEFMEKTDE